jgi:hypothetical protein
MKWNEKYLLFFQSFEYIIGGDLTKYTVTELIDLFNKNIDKFVDTKGFFEIFPKELSNFNPSKKCNVWKY